MALLRQFYTNFTSGELTPLLSSRVDSNAYKNGTKKLRNFRMLSQGGIRRRGGFRYLQTLTNTAYQSEAYIYDEDEAYILLFSNTKLEVIDITAPTIITQTITSCPWTTAMIGELKVSQSGDTMIVVHPDMAMQKLTRTAVDTFARTDYTFDTADGYIHQPYYKFADPAVTLDPASTTTNNQTITASAAIFSSDWVGEEIEFTDTNNVVHHIEVIAYLSDTTITGKFDTAPHNANAVTTWKEQVFSSRHGYARSVTFHDQRLIFGGSKDLPNHLFMSQAGEFFNFDVGTGLDDESIQVQIAENQISEIKSLASFRHLVVFTSEQELYVPTSENRPLTPSTIAVKKQTSYGSGEVVPSDFDGALVFLTKSKGAVREFIYSDVSQAYNADALTLLSPHLIGTPSQMVSQREAQDQVEAYLYLINSDGKMPVFMSIRKEQLQGWCEWSTQGSFKNLVNVNRQVYSIVERTINSATVTTLELLDNEYHTDSASKQTGSATKNWTVAHLPNTEVVVKSGNYSMGTYTTNGSGQLTLTDAVTSVEIGLNYTPELTTLPPEFQLQDGISVGQKRRVVRAVLDLNETLDVKTKGTSILIRRVTDDFSQEPTPVTERKEVYLLGWGKEGTVTITQDQPLPLTINGLLLEVEV
ncbi:MAG: hypothetical protein CL833_12060 [Crocinitomicaceae bacterium]|nr:hypothetical protein [Crocinitomicaceae bacterium]